MIIRTVLGYSLVCDVCYRDAGYDFDLFEDAEQYGKIEGWEMEGKDKWQHICPDCKNKGGE